LATEEAGYDTTLLTTTAVQMGHEVYITEVGELNYLENGHMGTRAIKVPEKKFKILENYMDHLKGDDVERVSLSSEDLDVLFLRNNPSDDTGSREWAKTAGMIFGQIASEMGVLVVNDPFSLMTSFNKMYFQHFPEDVRPRTIITRDLQEIKEFYKKEGEKIILKPLQGSGGKDVFLIDSSTNINQIVETMIRNDFIIAQEYLPAAKDGDVRVIMLNGKILEVNNKPAAIHRVNKSGDIRSNIHAGGTANKAKMNDTIRRLCSIVAPKLNRDGMFIAGIDIVGDKIMELNLDTPGGLVSMGRMEKENYAKAVIIALEKKIEYQKYYLGKLPNAYLATLDL
jgi:glutathione synthase